MLLSTSQKPGCLIREMEPPKSSPPSVRTHEGYASVITTVTPLFFSHHTQREDSGMSVARQAAITEEGH